MFTLSKSVLLIEIIDFCSSIFASTSDNSLNNSRCLSLLVASALSNSSLIDSCSLTISNRFCKFERFFWIYDRFQPFWSGENAWKSIFFDFSKSRPLNGSRLTQNQNFGEIFRKLFSFWVIIWKKVIFSRRKWQKFAKKLQKFHKKPIF